MNPNFLLCKEGSWAWAVQTSGPTLLGFFLSRVTPETPWSVTQAEAVSFGSNCCLPERPGVYTSFGVYTTWVLSTVQSSAPEDRRFSPSLAGIFFTAYYCFWGQWRQPHLPGGCLNMQVSPETSVPTFETHALSLPHARMQYAASHRDPSPRPSRKLPFTIH